MSAAPRTLGQLIRFGVIGLVSNGVLYLVYLFLTAAGVGPKLAMSLLFLMGVIQTFFFNKNWAFRHAGSARESLVRYFLAYLSAYCLNLLMLSILVDQLHWPHQLIQAIAIVVIALYLFATQKLWVFQPEKTTASQSHST